MAVDGDRVADPAVVAQVMAVAEILTYLGRAGEAPVVEHPGEVPVDAGRFRLLDDERPIEAAADLLEAALVGVVPEGAGVDRVELVGKDFAGADRGLGQMRHAVHGVRHAQAVPLHRCLLLEAVLDMNAQAIARSHATFRSRDPAVLAPLTPGRAP